MSPRTPILGRGLATLILVVCLGVGSAVPVAAADRYGVAVLPPRAVSLLAPLGPGVREWLTGRLAAAGVGVLPTATVDRDAVPSGYDGAIRREQVPALADVLGAAMVLAIDLRFEDGKVDLRLRLHDGPTGDVLTGAIEEGRVAEIGATTQLALIHLLEQLDFDPAAVRAEEAPRIADLTALGRARARLDAEEVIEAWNGLAGARGPAVDAIRAEIEMRVAAPEATPMLRSRFANATGQPDRSWLRVRGALRDAVDPEVLLAAGDAARARSDAEAAARFYERALELDPESFEAELGRAESLIEAGRVEEGRLALESSMRLAPEDPRPLRALGAQEDAAAEQRAQHWLEAGDRHARRLEIDAARAAYDRAAQLDPSLVARAHGKAARLDERVGNDDQALLSYEQAYELGLHDPALLAGLGRTRRRALDVEGAENAFRELVELEPESAEGHRGLGAVLGGQQRHEEAVPHLEKAVAIEPDDVRARRSLARVLVASGDAPAALVALDPTSLGSEAGELERAELWRAAAEIHAEAGEHDAARVALESAVALDPEDPPLHDALAGTYEKLGRSDAARQERALAAGLAGSTALAAAPTDGAGDESAERASSLVAGRLQALVETFPDASPETQAWIGPVILLPVADGASGLARLKGWLLPRAIDRAALEQELAAVLALRFELIEEYVIPDRIEPQVAELRALSTDREAVATVNDLLGTDAIFVARLVPSEADASPFYAPSAQSLEVRLLGGRSSETVYILGNQVALEGGHGGPFLGWNLRAAAVWLVLLGLIVFPFVRGFGTVRVLLDYELDGAQGFFNVKLSRRRVKAAIAKPAKGGIAKGKKFQHKTRSWSRYTKRMAGHETVFRFVPARRWYVDVEGLLQNPATEEVIGNYAEEREIVLTRGERQTVAFDFRPKEAAIEVTAATGEEMEPAAAAIALRGRPDTIRYLRGEPAVYHVGNGQHVLLAGYEDRVYEQQVYVQDLASSSVHFQVDREDTAVFTGCPDAVEPFLLGDFDAASQALEAVGQNEIADWLRGELHKERGDVEEAARYYEAAGRVHEAAEISAEGEDAEHAATLFEQAGDFGRAAQHYRSLGEFDRAASAFESAYDFDSAIECYREAGNVTKEVELLERTGAYFDAAQAARKSGETDRVIQNLQQVDLRDPGYMDACELLSDLFAERGESDLALNKLEEAVSVGGGEEVAPLPMLEKLADRLDQTDQPDRALELFEAIRARDFTYAGAAERVEDLKERIQKASATRVSPGPTQVADTGAPPTESRYEILSEIGRGGMGVVYQARDRRLGRIVALKRLPENLRENPTAVQLFLREARAAAALNHPNIVTLFDADQEDDNYYLTMEYLDGLPLDAILDRRAKLSVRDAFRLAIQIATGLQYAHENAIVHRDIKTSNLFFTKDKVVKIMDFGLAKMMEEVRRAATVIGGTPYYMAPEQATGEGVDHRADLYAFGVTLFELCTGRVPFREGDVTYHHRHTPAPDPRTVDPEIPAEAAALILHMMAKQPGDRPESAAAVKAELERITQRSRS